MMTDLYSIEIKAPVCATPKKMRINLRLQPFWFTVESMSKKTKREVREEFRESVFRRDGYTCRLCGAKDHTIDVHHIMGRDQFENGGYVIDNGITVCNLCHMVVEKAYKRSQEEDYISIPHYERIALDPNRLYDLISSCYTTASHQDRNNGSVAQ